MVHLSIASKLTLAMLSVTLIVLTATLLLARWSFEQGFLDYVNALEHERLERLAPQIAQIYQRFDGDWNAMRNVPLLREIERSKNRLNKPPVIPGSRPPHERFGSPPGGRPPPRRGFESGPNAGGPDRQAPGRFTDRQPPPRRPGAGHLPPTGLMDHNDTHIAGITRTDAANPIEVSISIGSEQIGTLISSPKRHLNDPTESQFAGQQTQASLWIALFAVLLALGVASLLARRLLDPVHRLHKTVAQLAQGHYELADNPRTTGKDELGQLQKNISNLANVLRENQSVRKRWLADISHELRTPITIMLGELDAVNSGIRAMDTNQVASLTEEAVRLNKIVEDLYELALSDIGGLRYQFVQTDVVALVEEVVASLNASQSQIEIKVNVTNTIPAIQADPARLRQLVLNLLRNSLLYTDFPGRCQVILMSESDFVSLRVVDTPPSVDPARCANLFEPLYREDASRSGSGAGLGLAICKNIAQAHGGTIRAKPSSWGGLEIETRLPVTKKH
ncbi:MAG: ATP-binding protein [Pseudomonadota bacterium]